MKQFSVSTLMLCAAFVPAVFLASCASQAQAERPAARQQSAPATEHEASVRLVRESAKVPSNVVLAASPVAAAAAAQNGDSGDAAKGKEVFEQCAICHNVDTDEEKMGPSLKGLFKKEKLKNGKPATEENVRAIIKAGGNGMPGYEELLEPEQFTDLIAYLRTV